MKWVVLSDLHMKFNNFDSSQGHADEKLDCVMPDML